MESIRSFLKSWPGRIFLMICLSPLVILGLESYFRGGSSSNEVAKVGDQVITRSQYQDAINSQRNELSSLGIDSSFINNAALNESVLDKLINQALLQQQAQKLGMHLSDELINNILLEDPQFLDENGQFSNERFAFALKQAGITKDQLFANYRQQLNVGQLYAGVAQTALYPDAELNQLLALQSKTRSVWLHRLPWEKYKQQVSVSDKEIQDYYHQNQSSLNSESMVDLSYVVLNPEQLEVDDVTDAEIQEQYDIFKASYEGEYNQEVSQILLTGDNATEIMQTIQQRLGDGETFAKLANEYSEDPVSKEKGGDIGTFNPDVFGEDGDKVAKAIMNLGVGEVSSPVKTSFGYQLFQVTDIDGESIPTLESVRDNLVARAKQQKVEIIVADKVTRINEMATDGVSIEDIASEEGLQVQKIKDYTELNNSSELNQPAVIEAAFDEMALQDESVSTNIGINHVSVWVQSSNYRPIATLKLEDAKEVIVGVLTQEKATELALADASKIASQVNAQGVESVEAVFTALGEVNRQTPQLTTVEKAVVFSQPATQDKLFAVPQATQMGASVLVMDVVKQTAVDNISKAERMLVAANEKENRGMEQFNDYLDYLSSAIEVVRNETVINEIAGL